jgi:hypothetical protein
MLTYLNNELFEKYNELLKQKKILNDIKDINDKFK